MKEIVVYVGDSLSLQMLHHQAEHWVVVKGTVLVEKDGQQEVAGENQSASTAQGTRHRPNNPVRGPMERIEMQSGSHLGEAEILRFNNHFGLSEASIVRVRS